MVEIVKFGNCKLKTPLSVSVMEIEGHFYATNNEFEICSDGKSEEDALELFNVYLEEMYERAVKLVELVN